MNHIIELEEGTKLLDIIKNFYFFNKPIRIYHNGRLYCNDVRKLIYENDLYDKTIEKIVVKIKTIDMHVKEKPDKKKYPVSRFVIN